jgi:hypothetical protein
LLASFAAAAALGLVWLVLRSVTTFVPALPFEVGITWPAVAFTFGVALTVGVLFGLSPALHATRLGLASALRDSTVSIAATRGRLQRGLVVAQIAFTQPLIVLLAAVLLFVTSQFQLRHTEYADQLISISLRLRDGTIDGSSRAALDARQQLRVSVRRLAERLATTPGVEGAAVEWGPAPRLGPYVVHRADRLGGTTRDAIQLAGAPAAANLFDVMGIRIVRGRAFARSEYRSGESARNDLPIIVGADLARRLWAGADPIGRRLEAATDSASEARTLVVVGVIDDRAAKTRKAGTPFRVYVAPDTTAVPNAVLVRTTGAGQPIIPAVREVMLDVAPDLWARIRTLGDIENEHFRRFRLITTGLAAAGLAALLLSAIGLYAVVAFSVGQRTREIAVRMAVGARGTQIAQRFIGDGVRLSVIGLLLGLPLSLVGLQALMTVLDEDIPRVALGPVSAVAAVGVTIVAIAAAWIPARRAAAVDPAITLRSQ